MLREYRDKTGKTWRVWDVYPSARAGASTSSVPHHTFVDGWLCFECGSEKRRLAPIPFDWELCDCDRLEALGERAGHISRTGSQPEIRE
jgi:hypothetical protein